MRPQKHQNQPRPQISTMPRQNTEAAAYLDIYKLVNEKKRLQKELETLEQKRDRIQHRLAAIETQVANLEKDAHQLRDALPTVPKPVAQGQTVELGSFSTLFLEY
jgi:predicted nuclease with TOPRIM domain